MKTISTTPRKAARTAAKKSRDRLTPAQVVKAQAMLAELDAVYGGRDSGSVDFLIKMRRGEA
ncbi:MAG: hypothetical protein RIS79_1170 [Verrucomicrobiota bacterium]|jgi:hypothetical protein